MSPRIDACLTWVLVDGERHHVKEYRHLLPKQRPVAYCPECHRRITIRIGPIRAPHAAHKPNDVCYATQPETALHINAKNHIKQELNRGRTLRINHPCSGSSVEYGCTSRESREIIYIQDWDKVIIEGELDRFRPDIVLMKNGERIGIIEVFVTHRLEPEKKEFLNSLTIPWLEVNAKKVINEEKSENNWTIEKPINYIHYNPLEKYKWFCNKCETEVNIQQRNQEAIEFAKQYITTAFRIIDFYYSNQKRYRAVYYAKKHVQNDVISEIFIEENHKTILGIPPIQNPILPIDQKKLSREFETFLSSKKSRTCIIDDHMKWQKWDDKYSHEVFMDTSEDAHFPKRYNWEEKSRKWKVIDAFIDLNWNDYFERKGEYLRRLTER